MQHKDDKLADMVKDVARRKAIGRPKKRASVRLSERRLIRLDPTLDAVVEILQKQKAEAVSIDPCAVPPQGIMRELMYEGARAAGLVRDAKAAKMIRLDPTAEALVEALIRQKAAASGVSVGSILPHDVIRDLIVASARAEGVTK